MPKSCKADTGHRSLRTCTPYTRKIKKGAMATILGAGDPPVKPALGLFWTVKAARA